MEGETFSPPGDERLTPRSTPSAQESTLGDALDGYRPDEITNWDLVRESLDLYIARFGTPASLHDLSVDELTARRIARSDFAGVVKIWPAPNATAFHPAIKGAIESALAGRDPWVSTDRIPLEIHMNVEDDSFENGLQVEVFGIGLAVMLGGLPRVVVARYRNFDAEEPTNK